ncbi:MAG: hypothetical protein CVU70_04130 [Deltaproteobacteria bacterium HGW-Deltaproteobacteria-5]|nr:MAG: hypothetical protein CVU70_04130 [Deltaproteobacteria bacterium HGW-Deltaproteobacteria-5]
MRKIVFLFLILFVFVVPSMAGEITERQSKEQIIIAQVNQECLRVCCARRLDKIRDGWRISQCKSDCMNAYRDCADSCRE